jgi:hypothetical protein
MRQPLTRFGLIALALEEAMHAMPEETIDRSSRY